MINSPGCCTAWQTDTPDWSSSLGGTVVTFLCFRSGNNSLTYREKKVKEEHIKRHNIERNCVIKFMDELLGSLKSLNNLRIIILSDHGSRITNSN